MCHHFPHNKQSKPSLSTTSQCSSNKIQTLACKTKQCGLLLPFQLYSSHFSYGSSHTDGFSFSHIPPSQPWTCFLCLEIINPQLFTELDPCHCSGLKLHFLREISPTKAGHNTYSWSLHLAAFLDSEYHTAFLIDSTSWLWSQGVAQYLVQKLSLLQQYM